MKSPPRFDSEGDFYLCFAVGRRLRNGSLIGRGGSALAGWFGGRTRTFSVRGMVRQFDAKVQRSQASVRRSDANVQRSRALVRRSDPNVQRSRARVWRSPPGSSDHMPRCKTAHHSSRCCHD